ncbi:PucR family transcriptional regulator ligand-binding domain-containing protein [Vallitalea sediminicola]
MLVSEIKEILDADILAGEDMLDLNIDYGYGCDLMSDVLAFVRHDIILLSGLVHPQVIRTAEMLDINAIAFVRGKRPSSELIRMAELKDIILLTTKHTLFTACGLLYKNGLEGEEIAHDEDTL